MLSRFILFAGVDFYPAGGAEDILGSYASISEAIAELDRHDDLDWFHILDIQTGAIITYGPQFARRSDGTYDSGVTIEPAPRTVWARDYDLRLGLA